MNILIRGLVASLLVLCACAKGDTGPAGSQGPKGDTGPQGGTEASVSGITPLGVYTGRDFEIQISGNNTAWTSTTTVNFGQGITVNKVVAASATSLVAQVTVAPNATLGPRDVTIADTNMDAFKGAFHVDAPMVFALTGGTLAQGSVIFGSLKDKDVNNAFDTTTTGDGFFTPISYPNIAIDGGTGFTMSPSAVNLYSIDFSMLIDVTAPTSSDTVTVVSGNPMGPASGLTTSVLPDAFQAQARTPMALMSGMPMTVTTTQPYESALMGISAPTAFSLDDIAVTTTDMNATPSIYLIPSSGKWADLVGAASTNQLIFLADTTDTFSGVLFDNSAEVTTYQVTHTSQLVASTNNEVPTADTIPAAQQVDALPYVMKMGVMTNANYQHVLRFNLASADVGKKIHAGTLSAGDPLSDTVVEIRNGADAGTSLVMSDDSQYLDDVVSDATTAAGDYWVVITASSYYDPMHQPYNAFIRLEQ
jgi:hypothetical protein